MAAKRTWTEAWSGERACCKCLRKAYYYAEKNGPAQVYCGYHLQKTERSNLPKNPEAKKRRDDAWQHEQQDAADRARVRDGIGSVRMKRLLMMRTPEDVEPGVFRVAPNYKPTTKSLHLPSLSPKSMGPVMHGCQELPPGSSLENYHQGTKIYEQELGQNGEITPDAWIKTKNFVSDPKPHRHKLNVKDLPKDNKNIPLYSIKFVLSGEHRGEKRKYSYLQSRLFYIRWYEHFCAENQDFLDLRVKVQSGFDIEILGYDCIEGPVNYESMLAAYKDASRPFGHEAVLCCLLLNMKPWKQDIDLPMYKDMFPNFLKEV